MTTFRAGAASDVGQIRSNNQDSKLVVESTSVFAVADGMGGHQGGEVASAIAVETLEAVITEPTVDTLVEAVKEANRRIFARAADSDELRGMGTTLVAIALVNQEADEEEVAWVNVGDSRVYLLRDDELNQLSQDHSLVEDLRRGGQLSEEEAAVHPQRNILTRALGIDEAVQVDTDSVMPFVGDRFLLCSDGLFNEVERPVIIDVLRTVEDPDAAAAELVRLANEGGGRDNITCVVVDVTDDGGRAARARDAAAAAAASAAAARAEAGEDPTLPPLGEGEEPDGAAPTATTVETPATQGDPAIADLDATPPAGLPAAPAPVTEPDPDAATAPVDDHEPSAAFAAPVAAGASGATYPDADDAPSEGTDPEELPFGRSTEDVFADLDSAGGRHWVLTALGVVVVLALVLGGAYLAGSWYAGRTYFLTAQDGEVQIYRGQPGGFLVFDPSLEEASGVALDDLTADERAEVEAEPEFDSLQDARTQVNTLRTSSEQRADEEEAPTTTTTEAPTTTTAPGATTTTPPTTTTEGP